MRLHLFSVLLSAAIVWIKTQARSDIPSPGSYPAVHSQWAVLNYSWDSQHTYADYYSTGKYVPDNCILTGISVAKNGVIYVSVPRWRSGVPATLNTIENNGNSADDDDEDEDSSEQHSNEHSDDDGGAIVGKNALVPYPSWEIQEEGVEGDLQNTQSMTIDSENRMWALEVGRRNFYESGNATVNGPAGVWIFDLNTGAVLQKYYFPDSIVPYNGSFLNDIALDETNEMAYFSDAYGDGAIIILDYSSWTSRRYSGPSTASDPDYVMIINGINYGVNVFTTPIDGIAVTADGEALFYCAVQNTAMYRLPTSVLRDWNSTSEEIDDAVEYIGYKDPSDGIKWLDGILYYGDLVSSTYDSVYIDDSSTPTLNTSSLQSDVFVEEPSVTLMNWIDTFAIDLSRPHRMWFTSNRLNLYSTYTMDFSGESGANMRIMYFDTEEEEDNSGGGKKSSNDDDLSDGVLSTGEISAIVICSVFLVVMGGAVVYFKLTTSKASTSAAPLLSEHPTNDVI